MHAIHAAALAIMLAAGAAPAFAMQMQSPQWPQGGRVARAQAYGDCGGSNVSPAISWSGAPAGARSFAITLYDPDAPHGWWHWTAFDIPNDVHSLAVGAGTPRGNRLPHSVVQGTNDFGAEGYGGPCPPSGDAPHRYELTLWALDDAHPPFGPDVTGSTLSPWLKRHALATATVTARYGR